MKKPKLFFVLPETLGVKEVKGFKRKFFGLLIGSLFLILLLLLGTNHLLDDVVGIGYNELETLTTENRILKQNLRVMTEKLAEIDSALDQLAETDNELRLMVDLPPLDEDIRRVGTGGTAESYDFGLTSEQANEILRSSTKLIERLDREIKLQRESYEQVYKKFEFNKVFFSRIPAIKPMEGFFAASSFGYRTHPVLQVVKFHGGLDIINDVGTPVRATGDGVVSFARRAPGYGITVMINHGYGYETLYAHLSKALVKEGQQIKRGDVIARSGLTGLVSGPHLHYEVRLNGQKQNPINFFFDEPFSTRPNILAENRQEVSLK